MAIDNTQSKDFSKAMERLDKMEAFLAKKPGKQMFRGDDFNPEGHARFTHSLSEIQKTIDRMHRENQIALQNPDISARLEAIQRQVNQGMDISKITEMEYGPKPPPLPLRDAPPPLPPRPETSLSSQETSESEVTSTHEKKGILGSFRGLLSKFSGKSDQHNNKVTSIEPVVREKKDIYEKALAVTLGTLTAHEGKYKEMTAELNSSAANVIGTKNFSFESSGMSPDQIAKSQEQVGRVLGEFVQSEINYRFMLEAMSKTLDELAKDNPDKRDDIIASKGNVDDLIKNSDALIQKTSGILTTNDTSEKLQIYLGALDTTTVDSTLNKIDDNIQMKYGNWDSQFVKLGLTDGNDNQFARKLSEMAPKVANQMNNNGMLVDPSKVASVSNEQNFSTFSILATQRGPRYELLNRDLMGKFNFTNPLTHEKTSALTPDTKKHLENVSALIGARTQITNDKVTLAVQTQQAMPEIEKEYTASRGMRNT